VLALYRKYRPDTFDEVIGQENIVTVLTNQVKTGRVGHAYLFTGSRGTGKTSCAKIFSRAINCLNPQNGSPCGECEVCKALKSPDCIDIIELDAASNNGVDEIREIREKVKFAPVTAKKKVYIIDEVHMLTTGAFNALLKTLEEPPEHVTFILATTEAHKLPATILSRCMRFDFKLVPTELLYNLVQKVYKNEGITADEQALRLIAKAGEGSVRDTLSVADRCMDLGKEISYEQVAEVLGVGGWETMSALVRAMNDGDMGSALKILSELAATGKSMSLIAKELTAYARDVLVVKTGGADSVVAGEDKKNKMAAEAEEYSAEMLLSIMKAFSELDGELRYSISPRIVLECAVVKTCNLLSTDLSALSERISRLEKRLEAIEGGAVAVKAAAVKEEKPALPLPTDAYSCWGKMLTYIRKNEGMRLFTVASEQDDVELHGDTLVVFVKDDDSLGILSEENGKQALLRAAMDINPDLKVKVDKRSGGVDMDSEIEKLKRLMGNVKVNVTRK